MNEKCIARETITGPDGRKYKCAAYIKDKYMLTVRELRTALRNGLPFTERNTWKYYNENDLHDYYSGRIGNDVKGGD